MEAMKSQASTARWQAFLARGALTGSRARGPLQRGFASFCSDERRVPGSGEDDTVEEARLVERARRGDDEAFAELFRRHRDYVLRLAARFGVFGDEAYDLLQDAFIVFFRKLPAFEPRAKLTTYLYPTVRFLALKRRSRRASFLSLSGESLELVRLPVKEPLDGRAAHLAELVAALPREQRELILLRYVDGMSLKEIAGILGIPLGTVKSRLFNVLRALKSLEEAER